MKRKHVMLFWLIAILLVQPPVALTQVPSAAITDAWEVVKATTDEDELEVIMRNGQKVRGRPLSVTDTSLRLSRKDKIIDLEKTDISRVYRLIPKSDEFRRLTSGVGATAGATVGLAIGLSTVRRSYGRRSAALIPVLVPVGGALGAVGGYILGGKVKSRLLIYEAK